MQHKSLPEHVIIIKPSLYPPIKGKCMAIFTQWPNIVIQMLSFENFIKCMSLCHWVHKKRLLFQSMNLIFKLGMFGPLCHENGMTRARRGLPAPEALQWRLHQYIDLAGWMPHWPWTMHCKLWSVTKKALMDAALKWVSMETKMAPYPGQFWITAPLWSAESHRKSPHYVFYGVPRHWCNAPIFHLSSMEIDSFSLKDLDHLRVWSLLISKEIVLEMCPFIQCGKYEWIGGARKLILALFFVRRQVMRFLVILYP